MTTLTISGGALQMYVMIRNVNPKSYSRLYNMNALQHRVLVTRFLATKGRIYILFMS